MAEINKEEQKRQMSKIFRHLDGIAVACTIQALQEQSITQFIQNHQYFSLRQILDRFRGNPGYINVAFKILEDQGWLEQKQQNCDKNYSLSIQGNRLFKLAHHYQKAVNFLPAMMRIHRGLILQENITHLSSEIIALKDLINTARKQWNLPHPLDPTEDRLHQQLLNHLEGLLVAPIMVSLAMNNIFSRFDPVTQKLSQSTLEPYQEYWDIFLEVLTLPNWIVKTEKDWQLTPQGIFATSKAYAYGVTISYLPLLTQLKTVLFSQRNLLVEKTFDGKETHVDRAMNIWASSRSHKTYFHKVKEIIIDIFNRPLSEQPLGIAEMGCGDGTLLQEIYQTIATKTIRGEVLKQHPVVIVGADYNQVSIDTTRQTLASAQIPNPIVIFGEVNDPDTFAKSLWQNHRILLQDLLSIRSFIDHNRPYHEPQSCSKSFPIESTGTFASKGQLIPSYKLIQNLIEHLQKWSAYVEKFGLLILELNIIPPKLVSQSLGKTLATPYDATQGYTDQYPVELPVFIAAAERAGLAVEPSLQTRYPPNELGTVSINYFRSNPQK